MFRSDSKWFLNMYLKQFSQKEFKQIWASSKSIFLKSIQTNYYIFSKIENPVLIRNGLGSLWNSICVIDLILSSTIISHSGL